MLSWEKKLAGIDVSQESFPNCFACGVNNPAGLKLKFTKDGDTARSEFTVSERHEGWPGFLHGGIICTILDEAIAYACFPQTKSVTAKAEFRFRQPAPVNVPMVATATLVKKTRKLLTATATLTLKDGTVLAEATAQVYVLNPQRHGRRER